MGRRGRPPGTGPLEGLGRPGAAAPVEPYRDFRNRAEEQDLQPPTHHRLESAPTEMLSWEPSAPAPHSGALDTAPAGPCWSSGSTGPCPLQWTLIAGWDLETRRIWRRKYRGQLIEIWVVLWAHLCPPNLYVEVQTQNRAVFGERAFAWVIEVWRGPVDGS